MTDRARRRLWAALLIALALVLSYPLWGYAIWAALTGLGLNAPATLPDCECPHLVSIVESVDWLGDGQAAAVFDRGPDMGGTVTVRARLPTDDQGAAQTLHPLVDALGEIG